MKKLTVITWARWKVVDPYDNRFFTNFTASVLKPSFQYPVASVAMSVVNGAGRVFIRYVSLDAMRQAFVIPEEYRRRLEDGYKQARVEAHQLQENQKALYRMSDMAPGSQVIRTDTGEIIAEVERFLHDGNG